MRLVLKSLFPCFFLLVAATLSSAPVQKRPGQGLPGPSRAEPWDVAFSPDTAAISARAAELTAGKESAVVILMSEARYLFDAEGRRNRATRLVYRIIDPSAVDEWSAVESSWSPWHEQRPSIRARVITSKGAVHVLDPATMADAPVAQYNSEVYSDMRVVQAPLPAVAAGAIVEEEIVVRETAPLFQKGVVSWFGLGGGVPTLRTRVTIEAPAQLPLVVSAQTPSSVVRHDTRREGNVVITFEGGPINEIEHYESSLPSDMSQFPYIAFSTGASWNAIAGAYNDIVDAQLQGHDVSPMARDAIGSTTDRNQIIDKLLARLQHDIRYTGVEFSEASIIPRTPSETLRRGYGDCKDKAALLVAMLRSVRIDAYLALLSAGPGRDVDPKLPGMGEFDHAIVYIPGSPAVWIDPTDEFSRAGEIPVSDQDRLALIASKSATALTRTPASTSAVNRIVARREFHLSQSGPARITETVHYFGSLESSARHSYSYSDAKGLQEQMSSYAKSAFLAKADPKLRYAPITDLTKPFEVSVAVDKGDRGTTAGHEAAVFIFPSEITRRIPGDLTYEPEEGAEPEKKREHDFVFSQPFTEEWEYKVVPPAGFVPRMLPDSEDKRMGTVHFTKAFSANEQGVVTAKLRLDTGKRRITPAEYEVLLTGIRELAKAEPIMVAFDHVGETHLAAGRITEALKEFRRMAALYPKEAIHRTRIARAFLEAGMGEAARKEAREATRIEPNLAMAWHALGRILQFDLIGRHFKKGFDYAGSEAALRKARSLAPHDGTIAWDLAIHLEHDDEGFRYGSRARLSEAVAQYKEARKEGSEAPLDHALLVSLMWSRQFAELKKVAESLETSFEGKEALHLVGIVGADGTDAAQKHISRLASDLDRRRTILEVAGGLLVQLRMYREAEVLIAQSAKGSPKAAEKSVQLDALRKTHRYETVKLPEGDPTTVVKRLLTGLFLPKDVDEKKMTSYLTRDLRKEVELEKGSGSLATQRAKLQREQQDVPVAVIVDAALGNFEAAVEGNDALGYRVRLTNAGMTGQNYYVVKEEGQYRVAAMAFAVPLMGFEVMRRADAGDLEGARQWLDWAREERHSIGGEDPYLSDPFTVLWQKGDKADLPRIRAAGVALMASAAGADAKKVLGYINQAREAADSEAVREALDRVLLNAYIAWERHSEALPIAEKLAQKAPTSEMGFIRRVGLLTKLKKFEEAEKITKQRLDKDPRDVMALRELADLAAAKGDLINSQSWLQKLVDIGEAKPMDYNQYAWYRLCQGDATNEVVELARKSATSRYATRASLHTLASVYADAGKPQEAMEIILQAIGMTDEDTPDEDDWFVFGRIAEEYGEKSAAEAMYRKVPPPEGTRDRSTSTWALAQRRLKKIATH